MMGVRASRRHGFVLVQSIIALMVAAVLIVVMLVRTRQYNDEAERQTVNLMVNTFRTALGLRVAAVAGKGPAALARIADENPFDWLGRKPDNYLGEYYSPDLKEMHEGNWLFDRRDKTLVYLPSSHKSFASRPSKFLKFKVEFAQAGLPGVKNGPTEVPSGLVIEQVDDDSASKTD